MKGSLVGSFVMCYVLIFSGLIVNFLMLCTTIFWLISKNIYRRIISRLIYLHWCTISFIAQWWANTDCVLYMDPEDRRHLGTENHIFLVNHRYEIDWVMIWIQAQRHGLLADTKVYAKDILKYVPMLGWAWYFGECVFLKRNWQKDIKILDKSLDNILDFPDCLFVTVLMFPEGTRMTPEKLKTSNGVAREKGYPELKYHLLPRTKGFTHSLKKLRTKFPAVYDCTVAYPKDQTEPRLWDVLLGKPYTFHMRVTRLPTKDIPNNEEGSAAWLREIYKEKDDALHQFLETGEFDRPVQNTPRNIKDLIIFIFWAVILCVPLVYYFGKIFLAGTLLQQAVFVAIIIMAALLMKWMVGFSEVAKGSSYGNESSQRSDTKTS